MWLAVLRLLVLHINHLTMPPCGPSFTQLQPFNIVITYRHFLLFKNIAACQLKILLYFDKVKAFTYWLKLNDNYSYIMFELQPLENVVFVIQLTFTMPNSLNGIIHLTFLALSIIILGISR